MENIILLTQGTGGDLYPFIEICRTLSNRGCKATLIADPFFEEVVKRCHVDFLPLYSSDNKSRRVNLIELYDNIKKLYNPSDTIIVSHDSLTIVSQTIAEKLTIPYKVMFLAPYYVMNMLYLEQVYNAESRVMNQFRANLDLPPVQDWREWLKSPKWRIGLWPEWFAPGESDWLVDVSPVGFVWNRDIEVGEIPYDVKEFVADGDPPILITHGTSEPENSDFFTASIEACKMSHRNAILVTTYDKLDPSSLTKNIRLYKSLPFASLLPYLGAIIHHGGIGTLTRALAAGVPQLVLARGHDRPDNGARVQRLGVGKYLPPIKWRPELIAEALGHITGREIQERCKQIALRQINVPDSAGAACDIIQSNSL